MESAQVKCRHFIVVFELDHRDRKNMLLRELGRFIAPVVVGAQKWTSTLHFSFPSLTLLMKSMRDTSVIVHVTDIRTAPSLEHTIPQEFKLGEDCDVWTSA